MELDDELCLCFHVTKRKVENYIRLNNLKKASQLTDCYGAGTGCGWCRPFLIRLFEEHLAKQADNINDENPDSALPTAEEYAKSRTEYVKDGNGTPPPGATPIL